MLDIGPRFCDPAGSNISFRPAGSGMPHQKRGVVLKIRGSFIGSLQNAADLNNKSAQPENIGSFLCNQQAPGRIVGEPKISINGLEMALVEKDPALSGTVYRRHGSATTGPGKQ